MKNKGSGWLTAEYSMLPRSGRQRNNRDPMKPNGRNMEISRLIGRALRTAIEASGVRAPGCPGPKPTTAKCPAGRARRATAEDVFGRLAGDERADLARLLEALCRRHGCSRCAADIRSHEGDA